VLNFALAIVHCERKRVPRNLNRIDPTLLLSDSPPGIRKVL
jgi:hypothetical protein